MSNKGFIYFIETGFARGIGQTREWWDYRLKIFEYYTLPSILNQSNKDFYLIVHVDNRFPLLDELERMLKKYTSKYIIINDSLESSKQYFKFENKDFKEAQYVCLTRIDSDDLFHKDVMKEIQQYRFRWRRALILQKGYCYNCINKKLQHYKVFSPPNSTIMFPKEIFVDIKKRKDYIGELHGHDQVFSRFNSIVLSEDKYIILVHSNNRRTLYYENAIELGRTEIPTKRHNKILKNFGVNSLTYNKIIWRE